jgi:hypothetical protein
MDSYAHLVREGARGADIRQLHDSQGLERHNQITGPANERLAAPMGCGFG